ncbi:unnamed protein product [Meloidogyne enterolobii]|uniref:Uncharacterized protein n=1 Tax=Meloidogyne enterolobii TaxID=390850 RepID=A0ACB0ZA34_MELEN
MDKKIGDLIKANNSNLVEFVEIKNKWSEIIGKCCRNNCINTDNPIGNCIKGNGFVNLIDDENISKYVVGNGAKLNIYIYYAAHNARICYEEKDKEFKLSTSFNNNDIYGCGLVYPPTNKLNGFPYIFFTQNGEQIGKAILLDNFDSYQPIVNLECCSIETNFGNDLKTKPFKYDISKHLVFKEFY